MAPPLLLRKVTNNLGFSAWISKWLRVRCHRWGFLRFCCRWRLACWCYPWTKPKVVPCEALPTPLLSLSHGKYGRSCPVRQRRPHLWESHNRDQWFCHCGSSHRLCHHSQFPSSGWDQRLHRPNQPRSSLKHGHSKDKAPLVGIPWTKVW